MTQCFLACLPEDLDEELPARSTRMNKRWKCPLCNDGRLAPSRPRMDDSRRYCLTCSEATGRLVMRECPALENKRKETAARRALRIEANQSKQTEHDSVYPRSLIALAHEWMKSPMWGVSMRDIKVVIRNGGKTLSTGRAWYHRLVVTAGTNEADGMATVLHELAHVATIRRFKVIDIHGWRWRRVYAAAAKKVTGQDLDLMSLDVRGTTLVVADAFRKMRGESHEGPGAV